jgi:rhodanese-related sulfurtransferase
MKALEFIPLKPYNSFMSSSRSMFRKPGASSFRQAVDWVAFTGAWAILFNMLHPSGIELKVRPSYEKTPSVQSAPTAPNSSSKPSYSGWNTPNEKTAKSSRSPHTNPEIPSTLAEWQAKFPHISLIGAQSAYADKSIVFIDARKPDDYAEGHIAGSLNFYADEYEDFAPRVLPLLSPEKTYVIYCNGTTCDLSHHLAERLSEQGFKNLKVFFNGWSLWKKASLPVRQGAKP